MSAQSEQKLIADMAEEMQRLKPFEFALKPHTAFTFIGCLQLASRHPHLSFEQKGLIRQFAGMLAEHFNDAPACCRVIALGWEADVHEEADRLRDDG